MIAKNYTGINCHLIAVLLGDTRTRLMRAFINVFKYALNVALKRRYLSRMAFDGIYDPRVSAGGMAAGGWIFPLSMQFTLTYEWQILGFGT